MGLFLLIFVKLVNLVAGLRLFFQAHAVAQYRQFTNSCLENSTQFLSLCGLAILLIILRLQVVATDHVCGQLLIWVIL